MTLTNEQNNIVVRAFMTAMARKLYRDGDIDAAKLNRLLSRIEKEKYDDNDTKKGS